MATTLAELAEWVGGSVLGDPETSVGGAAPVHDAGPGDISLIDRPENAKQLARCPAKAVVVPRGFDPGDRAAIAVDDAHAAFIAILLHFRPRREPAPRNIHPSAAISPTAILDDDVSIGPAATIGDEVRIGSGTTIHAGAHVMAGCGIGRDVTIFPNAVLHEETLWGDRSVIHADEPPAGRAWYCPGPNGHCPAGGGNRPRRIWKWNVSLEAGPFRDGNGGFFATAPAPAGHWPGGG